MLSVDGYMAIAILSSGEANRHSPHDNNFDRDCQTDTFTPLLAVPALITPWIGPASVV